MEHIKQLEISRLVNELEFTISDYSYKSELVHEIDIEFIKTVNQFLDSHPNLRQIFDEKISERIQSVIDTSDASNLNSSNANITPVVVKDDNLKHMYRSIVKSTHPDKIQGDNLKDIYIQATNAYDKNDIIPIISICNKLGIPYELGENETSLIKSEIKSIKDRVSFLESTFAWKWYNQQDSSIKNTVILSYIKTQLSK